MKALLKAYQTPITIITTLLLLGLLTWYVTLLVVAERTENLTNTIQVQLAEQRSLLLSIAETTARNGADQVTESIVRDCSVTERTRFDDLLSRLDGGLPQAELVELERLFGRCGSFYAERKLVMSSRLEREIEVYENYVAQLAELTGDNEVASYQIELWKQLSSQEQTLSQQFAQLVDLQDQIITTLLSGKARDSEEIQTILGTVKDAQETLIITSSQTATVRNQLTAL